MSQEPQPPAPSKAPSRLAWFLLGAGAASACFIGYGLLQRFLVQKMMSGLGLTPAAQTAAPGSLDAQVSTMMQQAQQALQGAQAGAAGQPGAASSLDLVSGPGGAPPAAQAAGGPSGLGSPQQAAQQGANLLGSVMPLLNNPALTRGMTPDQQKQMQQLVGTIGQLQGSLQSGKPMTPAEQQAMLQTVQQAMRGMPMQALPATLQRQPQLDRQAAPLERQAAPLERQATPATLTRQATPATLDGETR